MIDYEKQEKEKKSSGQMLSNFFGNTELLRSIRTIVSFLISIGLPMVYFGIFVNFDQLDITAMLVMKFSGLAVVFMLSIWNVRFEIANRAFEDERKENKDLKGIETDIGNEKAKIKDHDLGILFAADYNIKQRAVRDKQATARRLEALERRLLLHKVKGRQKAAKRVTAKIESLKANPIIVWWKPLKPIAFSDLYEVESHKAKRELSPHQKLKYRPQTDGMMSSVISSLFKSFGFGTAGSLPFLIGTPIMTILIFYGGLILSMIWTAITIYIKTRYKTQTKYLDARSFKRDLLKQCVLYIAEQKKAAVPSVSTAPEQDKTLVEVQDVEIVLLPALPESISKRLTA